MLNPVLQNVTVFGAKTSQDVFKLKWHHLDGPGFSVTGPSRRGDQDTDCTEERFCEDTGRRQPSAS